VRAHNLWARNWTVLVTLSGWSLLVLGLVRMFAASQYRQVAQATSSMTFMVVEGLLLAVGLTITINAYSRSNP
jgi:energy-converting hydrogenase Eha subunit C